MILRAKSGPRLVHGWYVAMTWLVPLSYKGGPHLPPIMAISEQFAPIQSRAAITIPDSALPPQRQFTKDPCWEGLAKWTVPVPLNFGSDTNTRPASGIARLLHRG